MKRTWIIVVAALVLLAAGGATAWRIAYPPEDPQVAKVKELQRQLFQRAMGEDDEQNKEKGGGSQISSANTSSNSPKSEGAGAGDVASRPSSSSPQGEKQTEGERRDLFAQLREQMENLTDEQRKQVMESARDMFRARMKAKIDEYNALPDDEKVAFLDKEIDRWEERRARFQQMRRERQASNQQSPGAGGRNQGGRPRGDGPDGRPRSEEDRQQRRRDFLAGSTPQERAEFAAYLDAVNNRREERGMETFEPWRR